jgi:hypothetical protein
MAQWQQLVTVGSNPPLLGNFLKIEEKETVFYPVVLF